MSREINVRAWDSELGMMLDGEYLEESDIHFSRLSYGKLVVMGEKENGDCYELTPLQYTGLKDKNGVEIYEGDVVEYRHDHEVEKRTAVMEFKYGRFDIFKGASCSLNLSHKMFVKVIGNIYENPELLP